MILLRRGYYFQQQQYRAGGIVAVRKTSTLILGWIVATLLLARHPRQTVIVEGLALGSRRVGNAGGQQQNNVLLSRIGNAQCALQLLVGRIPGTAMPPEWAASGAKLALPLEVEFSKEACAEYSMNKERLLGDGKPYFQAVEPLNEPTFVSAQGVKRVEVTPGAYGCELQRSESQQYSFRFFLDFPDGAVRNDVELPAGRIYFLSSCWIQDEVGLEQARERKRNVQNEMRRTDDELKELRVSSTNLLQKAMSLRRTTTLIEGKKKLETQLNDLEQCYPLRPDSTVEGPNGVLFPKEGIIAVKRYLGALGTREQYHWVGTFTYQEFFEDEEEDDERS